MSIRIATIILGICMALAAASALGQVSHVSGKVARIAALTNGSIGECAVMLDVDIVEETGIDCNQHWITFDCAGRQATFGKAAAARMFDSAKLAYAMDRGIRVWLRPEAKIGEFCIASRIDVLPP